jgi:DNA repair protein RadC
MDTSSKDGLQVVPLHIPEIELRYTPARHSSTLPKIRHSHDSYKVFLSYWDTDKIQFIEQFNVMLLNNDNRVLGICMIASGGLTEILVDARIIFALALKSAACAVILAHNHPSGNVKPSRSDKELTERIKQAGALLNIAVLDHLIITPHGFCSLADEGLM